MRTHGCVTFCFVSCCVSLTHRGDEPCLPLIQLEAPKGRDQIPRGWDFPRWKWCTVVPPTPLSVVSLSAISVTWDQPHSGSRRSSWLRSVVASCCIVTAVSFTRVISSCRHFISHHHRKKDKYSTKVFWGSPHSHNLYYSILQFLYVNY